MFVLLDTNIFVRDWRLTGNAFRVFLESLERIGLRWALPEIVHAEVENKAEERLAAVKEKLELAVKDLQFLPAVRPDALTFDAAAALLEYKDYFRKIAAGAQARMLPHPDVPHAQLALRATKKRRPFKENGSGYRDALLGGQVKSGQRRTGQNRPTTGTRDQLASTPRSPRAATSGGSASCAGRT